MECAFLEAHFFILATLVTRYLPMLNLILFGPPGSGKGTQAARLVDEYNLVHISTGDLFRSEMEAGTDLGLQANEYMSRGELVPDEVTIAMLRNKMITHREAEGFIFDGFPRTVPQAEALDGMLEIMGQQIDALILLDVPEEEIVKRILLRGQNSSRPDDNDEEIIRNRYKVYQAKTARIYDYYDAKGKACKISGLGTIDHIFHSLCEAIDSLHV